MQPKFSPSQIATFNECNRKWFFQSVLRVPRNQHPSAAKGEKVHKILEGYLETGILTAPETFEGPELSAIAESGLVHLPKPAHFKISTEPNWSFERQTKGELALTVPTILYNGRKDFTYDAADGIWTVGDHKTTSNLKYALTQEQLSTDPQGILYAADALQSTGRERVRLNWIYYLTKRPYKSKLVEVILDEAHVESELVKLDEIVGRKMLPLVPQKDLSASEVEPNLGSCDKYGGCPYREICDVSPVARLRHVFTRFDVPENPLGIEKEGNENMSSILERLKAAKAMAANSAESKPETAPDPGPAVNPPESTSPPLESAKAPDPEPAPEPAKEAKPKGAKRGPKPKTTPAPSEADPVIILLVDCSFAMAGELGSACVIHDTEIYSAAHLSVNAGISVEDYTLADFGKGAGFFVAEFSDKLTEAVALAKRDGAAQVIFVCDSRCREWALTSAVWRQRADSIIKGG